MKQCNNKTNRQLNIKIIIISVKSASEKQRKKVKMKKILLIIFTLFTVITGSSQDVPFINPNNNLLQTNPALIAFDNDLKLNLNYRSQYSAIDQNFKASVVNLTVPLFDKTKIKRWGGIGFSFISDKTGEFGYLSNSGINVAFAYNFLLSENQSIAASLSGGFFRRSLNMNGFTTGSQYIFNSGYDPSAPINESFYNQTKSYFDIAAGIIWQYNDGHKEPEYFAGISAFHLNNPNISFYGYRSELDFRFSFQGGFRLLSKEQIIVSPVVNIDFLHQTFRYSVGSKFDFPMNSLAGGIIKKGSLSVIPCYITKGIIACSIELNQPRYSIGFGYDYNTADLSGIAGYLEGYEVLIKFKKNLGNVNSKKADVKSKYKIGKKYKLEND